MSTLVYRIQTLLKKILADVPVGTNLGLWHLFLTILSGRLLTSRGALFPALTDFGLDAPAVRRADAALCYGHFHIDTLVANWKHAVKEEGRFHPHQIEGVQPVACDMTGFFRPQMQALMGKHYQSQADKALPAVSLGLIGAVGSVGTMRLALPQALVCQDPGDLSEKSLKQRTIQQATQCVGSRQTGLFDSGFQPEELLESQIGDFVVRGATNFTARRTFLPPYLRSRTPPEYGQIVRPLARTYKDKEIEATPPDATARWKVGKRRIKALIFNDLVPSESKPGGRSLRCVMILDPKYKQPLVLVTAYAL
jgi:hypothetical protein